MEDLFSDTSLASSVGGVLCEANAAGAALSDSVAAFMAARKLVHLADCAADIDGDQCFCDANLGVDNVCALAILLRDWDIRTAFA